MFKRDVWMMMLAMVAASALIGCAAPAPTATPAASSEAPSGVETTAAQPVSTESAATELQATTAATQPASTESAPSGARTFVINPPQSEAHFIIDEVLAGASKTVVGKTNLVEGSITANYADPSATTMDPIQIDLSGLATDSPNRNRMLHESILQTVNPAFQFAEFTMTRLEGLPDTVTVGQAFSFQIVGNLALHGVTKEVTFDATVTPVSDKQLTGKASLKVTYADWGIAIFRLPPQVASVADTAILEIEFVAVAQ